VRSAITRSRSVSGLLRVTAPTTPRVDDPSTPLPDAPLSAHRFSARFQELVADAHPPL
jgi:cellulase/cellobiase CelA1